LLLSCYIYIFIYIKKIKNIQEGLKTGSYGGPTFDDYSQLDEVMKENGCHRVETFSSTCDSVIYDSSYGKFY